jgi:hypothetical protein
LKTAAESIKKPVLAGNKSGQTAVKFRQVIKIRGNIQVKPCGPQAEILIDLSPYPVSFLIGVFKVAVRIVVGIFRIVYVA